MRIAYLPFYVDYYEGICTDFPREKAALATRCAETLTRFGEVVWDGRLIGDVETATEVGQKLARQSLDAVVVVTTIAVFGGISWAALRELNVPIVLWNAQQIETVGENYTMVDIVRNTGQIGIQALANTLLRHGRWFRVVTGLKNSPQTLDELGRLLGILRAAADLMRARLLAVGDEFPQMTDVQLDPDYLARHLGATIERVSPEQFAHAYGSADDSAIAKEAAAVQSGHVVADLSGDELERSVRISTALESLVQQHRADAGTLNCHGRNCLQNPAIGITACYSLGAQNAQGRPFTCTGDLPTALAMLLLKRLSGTSMYTEVQVMDLKRDAVVIANSGEGEEAIRDPRDKSRVLGNQNFTGLHGRGASFAYALKPGPATLASLTPTPAGPKAFRLVVAEGDILPDRLPDAGALAGLFRFAHQDVHAGYTRWLKAGPVHHAATTVGHWCHELAEVATLLDFEFVKV